MIQINGSWFNKTDDKIRGEHFLHCYSGYVENKNMTTNMVNVTLCVCLPSVWECFYLIRHTTISPWYKTVTIV